MPQTSSSWYVIAAVADALILRILCGVRFVQYIHEIQFAGIILVFPADAKKLFDGSFCR